MNIPDVIFQEIVEGKTKVIVPKKSLTDKVPPKEPVFFNPRAKLNRDFSIIAYAVFYENFNGPKIFLEGLSGVGIRGLRVANELKVDKVVINDLNPTALKLAELSAKINQIKNIEFSREDVCNFFSNFSEKGKRGTIVDLDPFGSPSQFFDCALRATMHNGMVSITATDLQVLNGLHPNACKRKYGGNPIRVNYGNELAIRLILGCLQMVSGRIGVAIIPLFVESNMHYYRAYVRILKKKDQRENLGYVLHCKNCGSRKISFEQIKECNLCKQNTDQAGPLWIGQIFDKEFVKNMLEKSPNLSIDKICQKTLQKCREESEMPALYYTLDEIAARTKSSPPKLEKFIDLLKKNGYSASFTSFCHTGFRTNANINEIIEVFRSSKVSETNKI